MKMPILIQKINQRLVLVTPRLLKKKPRFLIRILLRSLFSNFGGKRSIRSILFHTHYKCNLNCSHCYEKNFTMAGKKPLTLAEKKEIIAQCLRLGVVSFDFVGGESSLDPQLPELIEACRPERTYISLATNGYGFTEEKIKHFLDIGVDKMNVSLDNWDPEEHDRLRGKKGSHKSALKTMALCKKVGMNFHITTFVYKDFTKTAGFKKLVEYGIENRVRITFKAAVPLGEWEGKHEKLITAEDREVLFKLHKKHPFLVRTCVPTAKSACPALNRLAAITAYGDVLPCNTLHISLGNLRDSSLQEIIEKGKKIKYFKEGFKGCPPAEDMEFIETYLSRTYKANPYPIEAGKVFGNESDEYT